MSDATTNFTYHLPITRLRIKGNVTETTKLETGTRERTATSQIELVTDADSEPFQIHLGKSRLSDNSLSLAFSDEGLLVSTEAKSVGKMGQILKNVVGVVTTVVGTLGGFSFLGRGPASRTNFAVEMTKADEDNVEKEYGKAHPEFAKRRKNLGSAVHALADKLVELEQSIAGEKDATRRTDAETYAKLLVDGLTRLREEAQTLESHFTAWKSKEENAISTAHELVVNLSDLPTREAVELWKDLPNQQKLNGFWPVYDWFRIVLARKDLSAPPAGASPAETDKPDDKSAGVFYRRARPIELSLYTVSKDAKNGFGVLELSKRTIEYVVDGNSPVGFVEFGKTSWSEKTAELAFSNSGTLKTVKNSAASELAAQSEALKQLPAEVFESLKQANEIIDQAQVLARQGIEQRIAELEDQKKLIEARIARDGALATAAQQAKVKKLEAEIQLLKRKLVSGR